MVPALRLLRQNYPDAEIHVLVANEAVDILQDIPWIDKAWGFPRKRGKAQIKAAFPIIRQLRREKFDLSVDFVGNDRGAFLSLAVGAKMRIGSISPLGFWGRKYCYNKRVLEANEGLHEIERNVHVLSPLGLDLRDSINLAPELHIYRHHDYAEAILPPKAVLCHLSTSMPKKEWPVDKWLARYENNPQLQSRMVFSTGPSQREKALLADLKQKNPSVLTIKDIPDVAHFMALIKTADTIICGDSLPSHLAAGLGTKQIVLFGPTPLHQWHPKGRNTIVLHAGNCDCFGHPHVCHKSPPCMASISPEEVASYIEA